jgi:tetratricopeptide (TPR) repeat protein
MPCRRTRTRALAAAWLTLTAPAAFAAVDPFYAEALRQGEALYATGDYAAAAERLRLACFGLLDEPQALGAGLVRLALAQAGAGDRPAFRQTFDRITEVEGRFEAYTRASLPSELRHAFEARVMEWVPADALRTSSAFAQLIRNKELLRLQSLPAGQRRAELERLVGDNPGDPSWAVMLAETQVAEGDGRQAIEPLERALAGGRRNVPLECLLGRAALQAARCDTALARVASCDVRRLPIAELAQYLDCLTTAGRWTQAASVVISLSPETREERSIARREKQIARSIPEEAKIEPLPPYAEPAPDRKAPPPAPEPLADAVRSLRGDLARANTVPLMRAVVAAARQLAAQHPGTPEPLLIAGEAAYRLSDWRQAADLLSAGNPPDDRPELLFYLSVALYELGDGPAAAKTMRRALPRLQRTEIVERYIDSILGPGAR